LNLDDGTGMPHPTPRRRRLSRDEGGDGLGHLFLEIVRRLIFLPAADLPEDKDRFGLGILFKER